MTFVHAALADDSVSGAEEQSELDDNDAVDSSPAWCPHTPPSQPSEPQSFMAGQTASPECHQATSSDTSNIAEGAHAPLVSAPIPGVHSPATSQLVDDQPEPSYCQKLISDLCASIKHASAASYGNCSATSVGQGSSAGCQQTQTQTDVTAADRHNKSFSMSELAVLDMHSPSCDPPRSTTLAGNSPVDTAARAPLGLGKGLPARPVIGVSGEVCRQSVSKERGPQAAAVTAPSGIAASLSSCTCRHKDSSQHATPFI